MLGKILSEIVENMIEDENVEEVRVGRISRELHEEFIQNKKAHREEHRVMEEKIEAFIEEITAGHSCKKFNEARMDIWEKVYDEIGLSQEERGKNYRVMGNTRVIVRLDDKDEVAPKSSKSKLQ